MRPLLGVDDLVPKGVDARAIAGIEADGEALGVGDGRGGRRQRGGTLAATIAGERGAYKLIRVAPAHPRNLRGAG